VGSIEAESKFGPSSLLLVVGLRELRFKTFCSALLEMINYDPKAKFLGQIIIPSF